MHKCLHHLLSINEIETVKAKGTVSTWACERALQAKRCSGLCNVLPTLVAQGIHHYIDCNQCWNTPKLGKEKIISLCHVKINLASAKIARRSVGENTHSVKQLLWHAKIELTEFWQNVLMIILVFCVGYFFTCWFSPYKNIQSSMIDWLVSTQHSK